MSYGAFFIFCQLQYVNFIFAVIKLPDIAWTAEQSTEAPLHFCLD